MSVIVFFYVQKSHMDSYENDHKSHKHVIRYYIYIGCVNEQQVTQLKFCKVISQPKVYDGVNFNCDFSPRGQ